jgi:hypothetical protein
LDGLFEVLELWIRSQTTDSTLNTWVFDREGALLTSFGFNFCFRVADRLVNEKIRVNNCFVA